MKAPAGVGSLLPVTWPVTVHAGLAVMTLSALALVWSIPRTGGSQDVPYIQTGVQFKPQKWTVTGQVTRSTERLGAHRRSLYPGLRYLLTVIL